MILFLVGALLDALWTVMVRAIAKGQALRAGFCQVGFTALATWAVWNVVGSSGWTGLALYALGGGVGTWMVTKWSV